MLFAVLFIILFTLMAFVLVKEHAQTETNQHQHTIQLLANQLGDNSGNIKKTATDLNNFLTKTYKYQSLLVKNNNTVFLSYDNKQTAWLNSQLGTPKYMVVNPSDLQVTYQLDFSPLVHFVLTLIAVIAALSILFALTSAKLNHKLQSKIFRLISKQIANELAQINKPEYSNKLNFKSDDLDIPVLTKGIAEIKTMMVSQLKNTANLEVKAHIDSLTGVENRNRFVQFFENTIEYHSDLRVMTVLARKADHCERAGFPDPG